MDADEVENRVDEALQLLNDIRFTKTRTRDKAEKAIKIIEGIAGSVSGPFHTMPRGLVVYPDLLQRYLTLINIDEEDLAAMICRCIEKSHREALLLLLPYCKNKLIRLRLLPGRYHINGDLYDLCR